MDKGLLAAIMFMVLMGLFALTIFVLVIRTVIDTFSIKPIGIKDVPCYDNHNNIVLNLTCNENITCSNWGIAGDEKCGS